MYNWIVEGIVFPNAFKVKDGWYVPEADVKRLMKQRAGEAMPGLEKQRAIQRPSKGFVRDWK